MEADILKHIIGEIQKLTSPASLTTIDTTIAEQRNRLREDLREELRRSLNYSHIKLHPDLKKHGFEFTEHVKDTVASVIADVLIQDGTPWDHHPLVRIEPAVFLNPAESLRDAAVVIIHFTDGKKEHRSASFRYR